MKRFIDILKDPDLRRPLIYQVFTRFLIGLCIGLCFNFFLNDPTLHQPDNVIFILILFFFLAMAWAAHLRLDGMQAVKFDRRLFRRKKKPFVNYGDIIDYIDEEPMQFEDLDENDQDRCLLAANLVTAVLFLIPIFVYA